MMADILMRVHEFVRGIATVARQWANSDRAERHNRSYTLTDGQMVLPGIAEPHRWDSGWQG